MLRQITAYSDRLAMRGAGFTSEFVSRIMRQLFSAIVMDIEAGWPTFTGHIKGICMNGRDSYLRAGCVSAAGGVEVSGVWDVDPDEILMVMNVIVLGVPEKNISEIVTKAVNETGYSLKINITSENTNHLGGTCLL